MTEPAGPLLARGRSADVYAHTDGRVLRRLRDDDVPPHEVAAMRLARGAGYPVPDVFEVDGPDMILERIDGTDLLTDLSRRPWRAARYGRLVGDLTVRLRHTRIVGAELRAIGAPEVLVHADLHPGNVMLTVDGPMVIDWEGAGLGPRDGDAAIMWVVATCAEPDAVPAIIRPIVGLVRRVLLRAYLGRTGRPGPAAVDWACERRLADPNMRPTERDRIDVFRRRHGLA